MFSRVLIANRGEIACRIMRTLDAMGIESVLVHSARDRALAYVREHPRAVQLPDTDRTGGYLDVSAIISVAVAQGCEALHPGYGFLSENPELVRACETAGIAFIGPRAESMAALGDKAQARAIAVRAGVPVVPGVDDLEAGKALPLPILIKPVAGGGGKGMHVVNEISEFDDLVARARREAAASFGDDRLLFEKYLPRARHIEVQVVGLPNGEVIALGDRECSLQRRHQKVIEEAPAPHLPNEIRAAIHAAAEAVVREVGYLNAGTVEFVVSCEDPSEFYFLEVNTRLQVEHPVTEAVTGIDLVRVQLQVAYAQAHSHTADEVATVLRERRDAGPCGHACEARVYAENPAVGFLPSAGPVLLAQWPQNARVDTGVCTGDVVGAGYDPMIAKVIATGVNRESALAALDAALAESAVLGMSTNISFLRALVQDIQVQSGLADTRFIDREVARLAVAEPMPWWLPALAAATWAQSIIDTKAREHSPRDSAWSLGWRMNGDSGVSYWQAMCDTESVACEVSRDQANPRQWRVSHGGDNLFAALSRAGTSLTCTVRGEHGMFEGTVATAMRRTATADELWLAHQGGTWVMLSGISVTGAEHATSSPQVRSPMPGTVTAVLVAAGESVSGGQPLVILEAMKMEHQVVAPHAGVVSELACAVGAHVRLREVLAVVEPT